MVPIKNVRVESRIHSLAGTARRKGAPAAEENVQNRKWKEVGIMKGCRFEAYGHVGQLGQRIQNESLRLTITMILARRVGHSLPRLMLPSYCDNTPCVLGY